MKLRDLLPKRLRDKFAPATDTPKRNGATHAATRAKKVS